MVYQLFIILFGINFLSSNGALASGCSLYDSGLEVTEIGKFRSSGSLVCKDRDQCTLRLRNNTDESKTVELVGPNRSRFILEEEISELSGKIIKIKEYGSCYNDAENYQLEVEYKGEKFSFNFASFFP